MSDTPAFMVANLSVTDADAYRNYEKGFFPILKKHGGEFFTFDDGFEVLEGSAPPDGRLILFKFPSEEAAKAWFNDPEYQALSEHRREGTDTRFIALVHGLPPRK